MSHRRQDQRKTSNEAAREQSEAARYTGDDTAGSVFEQDFDENIETHFQEGLSLDETFADPNPVSHRALESTPNFFQPDQTSMSSMWEDHTSMEAYSGRGNLSNAAGPTNLPFESGTASSQLDPHMQHWDPYRMGIYPEDPTLREGQFFQPTQPPFELPMEWGMPGTDTTTHLSSHSPFLTPPLLDPIPSPAGTSHPTSSPASLHRTQSLQATTPSPTLVQLGASQNYLINSQPAPYIKVLDVDPTYQRTRTPSPNKTPPALCLLVRASKDETHYRAIYLRERSVGELIHCVMTKFGFGIEEAKRVKRAVKVTKNGAVEFKTEDLAAMESETEILVGVKDMNSGSTEWQLEVTY